MNSFTYRYSNFVTAIHSGQSIREHITDYKNMSPGISCKFVRNNVIKRTEQGRPDQYYKFSDSTIDFIDRLDSGIVDLNKGPHVLHDSDGTIKISLHYLLFATLEQYIQSII